MGNSMENHLAIWKIQELYVKVSSTHNFKEFDIPSKTPRVWAQPRPQILKTSQSPNEIKGSSFKI
jgi:hypothetical protein